MKFALGLFILAATVFVISNNSAVASHDIQSTASATEPADKLLMPQSDIQPMALPSCGNFDGTACSTVGDRFRCEWVPFEPGLCRCTSTLVWRCG